MSYLRGIADEELFDVVTTAALVSEARKFDVSCEARAPMSIDDTLMSGPTGRKEKVSEAAIRSRRPLTGHDTTEIARGLLS